MRDKLALRSWENEVGLSVTLSAWGEMYTPPGIAHPNFDMKTAVRKQVNGLDINTYFDTLAKLPKTNPPTAQDARSIAQGLAQAVSLAPSSNFGELCRTRSAPLSSKR